MRFFSEHVCLESTDSQCYHHNSHILFAAGTQCSNFDNSGKRLVAGFAVRFGHTVVAAAAVVVEAVRRQSVGNL